MAGGGHQEKPISVFYSYSHRDETFRGELEAHLSFLRRSKLIAEWHDRMIGAGDDWKGQIDRQLAAADIVLLLVSADFIASDYCWGEEMAKALTRHQLGETRVIPVILRPCRWQNTPLGSLQAIPKDGKPVSEWPNRDAAFNEIAVSIERTIADLQQHRRAAGQAQQPAEGRKRAEAEARKAIEEKQRQALQLGRERSMRTLLQVESFGAVDADNDTLLLDCFEDHEAFLRVRKQTHFLVVGRKGSGKTAIFKKMMTHRHHDYFCFGHTFSDYPWHHHDLQARVGIPDFDKFTHSWKYLILLTVSKIILNFDQSLPFDQPSMDTMIKIEQFIVDTYGTKDPDVTQVFTPSKVLRLKPHFDLDWKILKAGISPEQVPMTELPVIVQELNVNLLKYAVQCLNPAHEYYICFDQLDLGFDPSAGDYRNRLIGLLLAARDINVAARAAGKKLFVSIFLRDDIYDTLHFEDKNKLTENFMSLIEWDTPRTNKTLRSLMEKRFKLVLGDHTLTWDNLFDETKQMPGHQSKYQHILDRTYLRPRDIIKFTNSTLAQYKARADAGAAVGPKFENVDLNNARSEYSNYLISELDDEIHKHLPHYEQLVELLRLVGVWQFTLKELEKSFERNSELFKNRNLGDVLQELYDFSLIGFYRPGGRGYGGSEYVFKYKEPKTRLDPDPARLRIHPGLIEALGLKRFIIGASESDEEVG